VKKRADLLVVERGLAPSRARAQALILAGAVRAAGEPVRKAGDLLDADIELSLRDTPRAYVSRGGDKLAHALSAFGLDVADLVAADIGASTGGFTDCLLRKGARRVYAVDVGYGQLAQELRKDPRVVVRERTNARDLGAADFPEPIDLVTVDASFIGLGKLMPAVASIVRQGGTLVALVKPQFEAGRRAASRGRGVIRDPAVRDSAIASARMAIVDAGFSVVAESDSALAGPKGNVERFVLARRGRFLDAGNETR
jgi:23S rRNA (cytidine1920-2'-O)/16S rRNA (cytidine1409-2'-O)-methyltransferase